jgi:DNA-binding LacI/PurR family transcriptional regulator
MSKNALVGLVLAGDAPRVGVEPFIMALVAGMEQVLHPTGRGVLLLVAPDLATEVETYRRWVAGQTVEAVVVVNLSVGDVRPAELARLGLPAVLAGHYTADTELSSVVTDDAGTMTAALELLASLGHRSVGRISGPAELVHTKERSAAMIATAERLGLDVQLVESDYSAQGGVRAARQLLDGANPPTALVFDNDLMAVAALGDLTQNGVDVPGQVSVLACDDSILCDLAVPPLSAMSIDVHEHGVRLGQAVVDLLAGSAPHGYQGPPIRLMRRGSTGPAPQVHALSRG